MALKELVKKLLEGEFFEAICRPLRQYLEQRRVLEGLEQKARLVEQVMVANLTKIEIMNVCDFRQEGEVVTFTIWVRTIIQVEDIFGGGAKEEYLVQWFRMKGYAEVSRAQIEAIWVGQIESYNK